MKRLAIFFTSTIIIVQFLASCNNATYDHYVQIDDGKWDKNHAAKFVVPIEDTLTFYKVFLNVRNDARYPYRNVYFFMDLIDPSGKVQRDTIDIDIADQHGKWLGSGLGEIKHNRILLSPSVHLSQKGNYTFLIEQAMRKDTLVGLRDIGIRIEKNKTN
ncbi:MAG: gliding motility lipoprotein GldH [Hyphomicrobiales bacterium]